MAISSWMSAEMSNSFIILFTAKLEGELSLRMVDVRIFSFVELFAADAAAAPSWIMFKASSSSIELSQAMTCPWVKSEESIESLQEDEVNLGRLVNF